MQQARVNQAAQEQWWPLVVHQPAGGLAATVPAKYCSNCKGSQDTFVIGAGSLCTIFKPQ
jgi:hypothetical protein